MDNKGYNKEQEKEGVSEKKEKWMDNYVPYGKYPAGSPMDEVTFTTEKEGVNINAEVDNKEAEDNKKWKDNYVPYEEPKEEPVNE